MRQRSTIAAGAALSRSLSLALSLSLVMLSLAGIGPARAQDGTKAASAAAADEPAPKFDKAYLNSAASIKIGQGVWTNQCRHCHGNAAYPGKAPKLDPGAMEPDFIFDRVTNGFRKMPPWKSVFTYEERKGVVAYMKSDSFSP